MSARGGGTIARAVALALALAACGGGDDDGAAADGGGTDSGGERCAVLPDVAPAWLDGVTEDVIARLSGEREIRAGVTLPDRAQPARRDEARAYLEGALAELGLDPLIDDYGTGANVYAELAPTEGAATGWLVVGAHFDGVATSPGANDNATGVALVVAAARYLTELPCRRQGVIVALFDEEEVGLVGSGNFAALLDGAGLPIDSVHTIDQMGWDQDGDRAIELELPAAGLAARYEAAADAAGLAIPIVETDTPSSDHQAFRQAGYAAVGVTEEYVSGDTTPYYHTSGDTYETVDLAYLASTARLVHAVVGGFALGDAAARTLDDGAGAGAARARLAASRAARVPVGPVAGWVADPRKRAR